MENNKEKRKVVEIPIKDVDGRIQYYIIPNYTLQEEFETKSERNFHRELIRIIRKLNEYYKNQNIYIQISTQVAINRIININNERNSALYDEIKDKSIDYVLYDFNTGKILYCIELNGKEHETDIERKERDLLVSKMFENLVKLKFIKTYEILNIETLHNEIKREIESLY